MKKAECHQREQFIDALRECLGLAPLYRPDGPSTSHLVEHHGPFLRDWDGHIMKARTSDHA